MSAANAASRAAQRALNGFELQSGLGRAAGLVLLDGRAVLEQACFQSLGSGMRRVFCSLHQFLHFLQMGSVGQQSCLELVDLLARLRLIGLGPLQRLPQFRRTRFRRGQRFLQDGDLLAEHSRLGMGASLPFRQPIRLVLQLGFMLCGGFAQFARLTV